MVLSNHVKFRGIAITNVGAAAHTIIIRKKYYFSLESLFSDYILFLPSRPFPHSRFDDKIIHF
jgi:hypothetical protein